MTPDKTRLTYNCAHLKSTKESLTFEYDIRWYWVSRSRYWLVLGGTGSVWGGNGWYLVLLGQFNLVLLGIKWYWVGIGLLCLYVLKKVEIWLDVTIA